VGLTGDTGYFWFFQSTNVNFGVRSQPVTTRSSKKGVRNPGGAHDDGEQNLSSLGASAMTLAVVLALASPAAAQEECRIKRVGGPNRFSDPVRTQSDLQAMFKQKKDEIDRTLGKAGWAGDPADLHAAIAKGASKKNVPTGTDFEWMFRRVGGTPELLRNECYGGAEPIDVWASTSSRRAAAGISSCRWPAATWP
jgi:hypothetical protein